MNEKIKIGDKIIWGNTIYTITDISLIERSLDQQILFQWQEGDLIKYVWYYSYHELIDSLNAGLIYIVDPMTPIKQLKKISL